MNWQDISSFSRDEEDKTTKTVETKIGELRLIVTRHKDFPGSWLVSCRPFYDQWILESKDLEEAKKEARRLVLISTLKILEDLI